MNAEQRSALRKLAEALDQLRNGTLLDEYGNHDDDSLTDIAGNCPPGWAKSKLMAHSKRITAANPSTILSLLDYIKTLEKDAAHKPASAEPLVWYEGYPPFPQDQEWFIAVTKYRDKVVLRALPEEYNYDYKTADETYMKKELVVQWAQFPDCEYLPPQCKEKRNEHSD